MPTRRQTARRPDVVFEDHGLLWFLRPLTDRAEAWVRDHVQVEPGQRTRMGIVVDSRYAPGIADAMRRGGLTVVQVLHG